MFKQKFLISLINLYERARMLNMGIEVYYRTSKLKGEIVDVLIEIHALEHPILLWQNEDGKRNVTKVKVKAIDAKTDSIFLIPNGDEDLFSFSKIKVDKTFYLRVDNKSIVFKQVEPAKKTNAGYLQIHIPNEVKLFEKRTKNRVIVAGGDPKITADIFPGGRLGNAARPTTTNLIDVSNSGISIFLLKKHSRLFFVRDKIKISRIGNHIFPRHVYGEIIHTTNVLSEGSLIRIGVKFFEKITNETLNSIQNIK